MHIQPTTISTRFLGAMSLFAIMLTFGCTTIQDDGLSRSPAPGRTDLHTPKERPPSALTLYRMGKLLAGGGKQVRAEAVFATCLLRYPQFLPAYVELAGLYVRHRKLDAAINILERGLLQSPEDPILRNDLGMCWLLDGAYQQALDEFNLAAKDSPHDHRIRANQAMATGMLGRYEEALALYKRVVRPQQAHYNLAIVCEARKDTKRAAAEFAIARSIGASLAGRAVPAESEDSPRRAAEGHGEEFVGPAVPAAEKGEDQDTQGNGE